MTEREIFTAALAKGDRAERAAFLDEACAGETALRERVESLLAEHQQLGSFMDVQSQAVARRTAGESQPRRRRGTSGSTGLVSSLRRTVCAPTAMTFSSQAAFERERGCV